MSPAKYAPVHRRPRQSGFSSVVASARLHLCAVPEDFEVRARHVAALLAFTPNVRRDGNRMLIRFDHGPTALWLTQVLASRDVQLLDAGRDGGVVEVCNPQIVLGRFGFREGRWIFGHGVPAAVGISRGAVHAAATFTGRGVKVACPSAAIMLTLTAVMARLGINAKPTEGAPHAAIRGGDVPAALDRLGIAAVAAQYRRLRDVPPVGGRHE